MKIRVGSAREILESLVIDLRVWLQIRRKTKRKKIKKRDGIVRLILTKKRRKKIRRKRKIKRKIVIKVNTSLKTRKKRAKKIKNIKVKSAEDLHLMMIQMKMEVIDGLLQIVKLIMENQGYCLTFLKIGVTICLKNFMILITLTVH